MKTFLSVVFSLALCCNGFAQDISREQKFRQIKELNAQIEKLGEELLRPAPTDLKDAETLSVKVFRLMPRETNERQMGHSSFYSFTSGSHDYQKIAQILLEQNALSTGFAGADYGLIGDLGNISLADVKNEIPEVDFLLNYKAPTNILDARIEQRKRGDYRVDNFTLRAHLPAVVGHTYVLRAISFRNADILVALKIIRKDTDGSLIVFWKRLADFPKPELDPNIREN
jgi:hypothetical protein